MLKWMNSLIIAAVLGASPNVQAETTLTKEQLIQEMTDVFSVSLLDTFLNAYCDNTTIEAGVFVNEVSPECIVRINELRDGLIASDKTHQSAQLVEEYMKSNSIPVLE